MPLHIVIDYDIPRALCGMVPHEDRDGALSWPEGNATLARASSRDEPRLEEVVSFNVREGNDVCTGCQRIWRGEVMVGTLWIDLDFHTMVVISRNVYYGGEGAFIEFTEAGTTTTRRLSLFEFLGHYVAIHPSDGVFAPPVAATVEISGQDLHREEFYFSSRGRTEGLLAFIDETRGRHEQLQHELNRAYQQISKLSAIVAHMALSKVNADPDHMSEDMKATIRRYLRAIRHGDAVEIHVEPRGEVGVMIALRAAGEPEADDPQTLWKRIDDGKDDD
jgi:hypothetical protein